MTDKQLLLAMFARTKTHHVDRAEFIEILRNGIHITFYDDESLKRIEAAFDRMKASVLTPESIHDWAYSLQGGELALKPELCIERERGAKWMLSLLRATLI